MAHTEHRSKPSLSEEIRKAAADQWKMKIFIWATNFEIRYREPGTNLYSPEDQWFHQSMSVIISFWYYAN